MQEGRTSRRVNRPILIEGSLQSREVTRPVPAPERADKWISRAATATVAGLAGIVGAISYSHMRQLAFSSAVFPAPTTRQRRFESFRNMGNSGVSSPDRSDDDLLTSLLAGNVPNPLDSRRNPRGQMQRTDRLHKRISSAAVRAGAASAKLKGFRCCVLDNRNHRFI